MKITFEERPETITYPVIVPVFESDDLANDFKAGADAIKAANFTGKSGQRINFIKKGFLMYLVGCGKRPEQNADSAIRDIGGNLARFIKSLDVAQVAVCPWDLNKCSVSKASASAWLAFGLGLGAYSFDVYKTDKGESKDQEVIVFSDDEAKDETAFEPLFAMMDGIYQARDLISEPANMMSPADFVDAVKEMKLKGVNVKVLDKKQMQKLDMNLLLNVAAGAAKEPYLLVLEYMHGKKNEKPSVLVGKGVCYDSGGMNLKSAAGLTHMKYDMSGGAAVVGTVYALSKLAVKQNVVAIVPLVENILSSTAQHVDDIWTSMSGKTVEIGNTDAEGRLILADALWYGQSEYDAGEVIDIATLTGVMSYIFADQYAGIFSNDDDMAQKLLSAADKVPDKIWRLPLNEAYGKMMKSNIADLCNIGGKGAAGSATAAMFIKEFVKPDTPWTHIDMASVCWSDADKPCIPKGATGFGVALLTQYILDKKCAQ